MNEIRNDLEQRYQNTMDILSRDDRDYSRDYSRDYLNYISIIDLCDVENIDDVEASLYKLININRHIKKMYSKDISEEYYNKFNDVWQYFIASLYNEIKTIDFDKSEKVKRK